MCGIVCVMRDPAASVPPGTIERMTADISHRGPDDEGIRYFSRTLADESRSRPASDQGWSVALGARRLSILDLSQAGHMPMICRDRFWGVYNGEAYNFIEVRADLEELGHTFHSTSDTEVILAAYAEWGPDSFARFRGMWGLAIFDRLRNEVVLCRDRLGIKPLYMWRGPGIVAVVSEIKQLLPLPGFTPRINSLTVNEYLRTGYEDPTRTFFRDVWPVPAGCWLRICLDTLAPSDPRPYWHPERVSACVTDPQEAGELFANKLTESVRIHLRSDVPIGCALSGGLDSSAIAALVDTMKRDGDLPLHTLSCIFPSETADESGYIQEVVSSIRAISHYVTPDPRTFLTDLDGFVRAHDEPVGGLSVYASYCLARLTREAGITVTLNGQGGDEVLSGYWQCYFMRLRELARQGHIGQLMCHVGGALTKGGNPDLLAQVPIMLRRYRARSQPSSVVRFRTQLLTETTSVLQKTMALSTQARRVHEIRSMFLPRLLKWDDRNAMAFSVEGRYPFLDHELIELCLSFAPQTLQRKGWTKWPLRQGLRHTLPAGIRYRRTKLGFEIPQDAWLCGPLRPTLESWLLRDGPIWEYVERADVRHLAEETWRLHGKRRELGQALLRLFIFDRWTQVFSAVA